jgi:hypothetical protein
MLFSGQPMSPGYRPAGPKHFPVLLKKSFQRLRAHEHLCGGMSYSWGLERIKEAINVFAFGVKIHA